MLKLSKRVEYGLISLLHMDSYPRILVTAKEIAEEFSIPGELLGKVLQTLAKAGVVESVQGARGGYRLVRPLEQLSVGEVVEKLDGPILIAGCCDGSTSCRQHSTCNIKMPIQRIQDELVEHMYGMRLDQFRTKSTIDALLNGRGGRGRRRLENYTRRNQERSAHS